MIELKRLNVLRGPNVWARMPVILAVVDIGELEARPTNQIEGFADRLLERAPGLREHRCSRGYPGGFVERLHEGTWMGHVLVHLTLELQAQTGADVTHGVVRSTDEPGVYNAVIAYAQEDVGLLALRTATRLLNHLLYDAEPAFDLNAELEQALIPLAERLGYGPSTQAIVNEADRRGIPVLRLDPALSLVQLGHGIYQKRVWATIPSSTSNIAVEIACNKAITNRLLRDAGLASPEGVSVSTLEEALNAAARITYPVVVKPLDGNHGRGVTTGVDSEQGVRVAFTQAANESKSGKVLIERHLSGTDYRVLIIDGEVVAVAQRLPAQVTGDGLSTLQQLIDELNADPRRGIGHEKALTRVTLDAHAHHMLAVQDLRPHSIPADGQVVLLRQTGNISSGGTAIDRTCDIHPDNADLARQAARVIGLDVAGIDLICPDISQSVWETGGGIVEVNAAPGFRMHLHPTEGTPRPVARAIVDMLIPPGTPSRVPIFAVTGTNGKTTTARMIAAIMREAGHLVGLTSTDGIMIDRTQIAFGDMAGPQSAQTVLKHPLVDCAVLECARGGIVRSGLGFDRCNVAVVTNIASDHLGLGGIDTLEALAEVKAVVPASVFRDGCSVLNADDPMTPRILRRARGEIIFFSMNEEERLVREHLRERGRAVVLRPTSDGEAITLVDESHATHLLYAHEIPATFGGAVRVNIANALAAAAAAIGGGTPIATIVSALRAFSSDFSTTPGRFNLIEIEERTVLMDYCHNVPALERLAEVVRRFNAPHACGVITAPGDRAEADILAFGKLAASIFDQIILREDDDPRKRARGEIAALLERAILSTSFPSERLSTVLDEVAAAHAAIDCAAPGDLVVIMVDTPRRIWSELRNRASSAATPPRPSNLHIPAPSRPAAAPGNAAFGLSTSAGD